MGTELALEHSIGSGNTALSLEDALSYSCDTISVKVLCLH